MQLQRAMSYSLSKLREKGEDEEGKGKKEKGGLYGDVCHTPELLKISMLGGLRSQFC